MSYYMLLALLPTLVFAVAIAGWLVRDEQIKAQVIQAIINQLPPGANLRAEVTHIVEGVAGTPHGPLEILGGLGAMWTMLRLFGVLRRALNRAFEAQFERSPLHARVMDLFVMMLVLLLSATSVGATTFLGIARTRLPLWNERGIPAMFWALLFLVVPLILSFVSFLVVYRFVPNVRIRVADVWQGALLAALGFEGAKIGLGLYIANFQNYERVYGTLGAAVAFLTFVYVVATIVIFAAEVIDEYADQQLRALVYDTAVTRYDQDAARFP